MTTADGYDPEDFVHLGRHFFAHADIGSVDAPQTSVRRDPFEVAKYYALSSAFPQGAWDTPWTTTTKENDMYTNQDAAELAREILSDKNKTELRGRVEEAVAHLQDLVSDTQCGSTLTFMKTSDDGKQHYFYAVVKNGGKWYTTAVNPRVLEDDSALIEWLIGLEIFDTSDLEHIPSAHMAALEAAPIETTATES